jgi:2-C-methyl-D-erythritol 4-phosphate cytidylyltransferase
MTVAAVLVAGGDGQRLGAAVPKAFCEVAGRTLLEHAAMRFTAHPQIDTLVVVVPEAHQQQAAELVPSAQVVAGGATRQRSVAAGLALVPATAQAVLVHDVARPFVPVELIDRVVAALAAGAEAVVPVLPVTDTVRRRDATTGELVETLDRATLVGMQTPQGFRRDVLVRAYAQARGDDASDDAALVEALGVLIATVPGAEQAFKITGRLDLALAELVARGDVAELS